MRDLLGTMVVGLGFGFALSRIGFSSWDEVHRMFTFADLRLLLTFVVGVVGLGVGWQLVQRTVSEPLKWPDRAIHPGTLTGGALFGAGWAITGACPSIALVQLGEGQLMAMWTLVGIFVGNYVYSLAHERYFRWDLGSCIDD